jgi:O-methyltransferase
MRRKIMSLARNVLAKRERAIVPTMVSLGRSRLFDPLSSNTSNVDYIRLSSIELCLQKITAENVPGALAEVGVYQGDLACMINRAIPDRDLYLFDTFSGFDEKQEQRERNTSRLTHTRDFSDTSTDLVASRMTSPQRCKFHVGFFPATAAGLEGETFSFVSLDADLYEPTRDGLEWFWPRLNKGGYIFVHDYNNAKFPGAKQAVDEFAVNGPSFVPLTDVWGSAVFAK